MEFLVLLPLFPVVVSRIGIIFTSLHFVFVFLYALQLSAWFLLFFLVLYSVSYRIGVLTSFMSDENEQSAENSTHLLKKLGLCARTFDQISQSSKEVASTFSLSVLIMLTFITILCATSLFFFSYALTIPANQSNFISQNLNGFLGFFIACFVFNFIILIPAGFPVIKVLTSEWHKSCNRYIGSFYLWNRWTSCEKRFWKSQLTVLKSTL